MIRFFCLILCFGCSDGTNQEPADNRVDSAVWFAEVSEKKGVEFEYFSGAQGNYNIIETMGGGVALFDFDNDDDVDLYITQGNVLNGARDDSLTNSLFENVNGSYIQREIIDDFKYSIGVATGDFDNDGFVDLYVTNLGPNTLLRNKGDGTFEDVTKIAQVGGDSFSACAEFADLDNDGDLDLFVTNYLHWLPEYEKPCFSDQNRRDYCNPSSYNAPAADTLYINNGDGSFKDTSLLSGIIAKKGTGLGLAIGLINEDKLPDIFVANDGMKDFLWINQGDGTFSEQGVVTGCAVDDSGKEKASMGVELFDIDNDSDLDLLITTLFRETDSLFINEGGVFFDSTARWGLAADTRTYTRWGVLFEDFNNDGLVDLYEATGRVRWQSDVWDEEDWLAEPNLLFTQQSMGRFSLVRSDETQTTSLIKASHGIASGDLDNDGGMDLIVVNKDKSVDVLANQIAKGCNWIKIDVQNQYGAPAIGAKVMITLDNDMVYTRFVRTSRGYASSSDPRIHIGLNSKSSVKEVIVEWQDESSQSILNPEINKIHFIRP